MTLAQDAEDFRTMSDGIYKALANGLITVDEALRGAREERTRREDAARRKIAYLAAREAARLHFGPAFISATDAAWITAPDALALLESAALAAMIAAEEQENAS